jgi:predicted XRE-type DNA-binding protein
VRKPNVFDQLGFSQEESDLAMMKTELITKIAKCAEHYSQSELREILGASQPRISNLLTGKIANFSLDTLIEYAAALKMRPEIKTHKPVVAIAAAR